MSNFHSKYSPDYLENTLSNLYAYIERPKVFMVDIQESIHYLIEGLRSEVLNTLPGDTDFKYIENTSDCLWITDYGMPESDPLKRVAANTFYTVFELNKLCIDENTISTNLQDIYILH
jgi:hypothetical protein